MKAKIIPIFVLLVAGFVSCDKDNEIKSDDSLVFSFRRSGGWTGLNENLEINSESTHYSISYINPQSGYQTTIKTSDIIWNELIKTFDLETFKRIQNGACASCVDGIDVTFSVTKEGQTYSFYNGGGDENYQKMQEFFDTIYEQVKYFEDKQNMVEE